MYYDPLCTDQALNLNALIVGYGQNSGEEGGESFWTVKNSWGAGWGEAGFVRVARNVGVDMCGVTALAGTVDAVAVTGRFPE